MPCTIPYADGGYDNMPIMDDLQERFWSRVKTGPGCWVWTGHRNDRGYGVALRKGVRLRAHRLAWTFTRGPVPRGKMVLHTCDNPPCVRPSHLFIGTNQDNIDDMVAKGRSYRNRASKLTEEKVKAIKVQLAYGAGNKVLADLYGVSPSTICDIKRNRRWSHVT